MSIISANCREALKQQLIEHQALKLNLYQCKAGKAIIGVGRNLSDDGINEDEAMLMLDNDIYALEIRLYDQLPSIVDQTDSRKMVLLNMAFSLGIDGLLKFRRMLTAVEAGDYRLAANEMLDSQWAMEMGKPAIELSLMMAQG